MDALKIILGIVMALLSVAIIIAIVLQEGRRSGINGAISGGAESFLSKNKARDVNAKLARITKYMVIAFIVISVVINVIALI